MRRPPINNIDYECRVCALAETNPDEKYKRLIHHYWKLGKSPKEAARELRMRIKND